MQTDGALQQRRPIGVAIVSRNINKVINDHQSGRRFFQVSQLRKKCLTGPTKGQREADINRINTERHGQQMAPQGIVTRAPTCVWEQLKRYAETLSLAADALEPWPVAPLVQICRLKWLWLGLDPAQLSNGSDTVCYYSPAAPKLVLMWSLSSAELEQKLWLSLQWSDQSQKNGPRIGTGGSTSFEPRTFRTILGRPVFDSS